MKKTYMRQIYMGVIGDMKNLEHHFSIMAEQGWMIDSIGVFTHRYRAIEPCKKNFFVDLLPQITAFDYPGNEDAQDYRSICEESGWTFITANKQFNVFCAEGDAPAPMPIHTDNKIQAQIYLKASRKYEIWIFFFTLFMLCFFSPLNRGVELFLSNMYLFMSIGFSIFLVGYLWTFGFAICWYLRTRKSAKKDLPMPDVNYRLSRIRGKVFAAGAIMVVICTFIGVVLEIIGGMPVVIFFAMLLPLLGVGTGLWIRRQVDTKRRTRAGNIGLTVAAFVIMELVVIAGMGFIAHSIITSPPALNSDSLGNRPALTLKEVGVTTERNSTGTNIKGTVVFPVDYEHWESIAEGTVNTHVYRSVSKTLTRWLYKHLSKEFTKEFAWRLDMDYLQESIFALSSDEAAFWGAEKGVAFNYANSNALEVLLWKDKTILRISAGSADLDLETVSQAVRNLWTD